MSDEKKRVPKLRFPGFTEEWEQRKLGDICSIITKGTTPKDKSGIGEVNFIKVENINLDNGEITGVSRITMEEHEGYLKRSRLEEDDILFSIAGTLGRVSVVKSSVLPANTNQALAIIRTKEGSIPYISTVLKGRAVEEFIRKNPTIGAQPNLSLEQLGNLEIPFPDEREQEKIGSYFQSLNNLITLHQCRLKHWEEMKKGLLQQMFPKKGETCPQIRFPEFNDDWEQRKLIDVCDYVDYRGKTPTKTDSGVFLITAKNVKDGYIDYEASQEYISEDDYEEVMRRGKPEIGDVLITTEAPCGNVAQVNRSDIALAQRIIKYRGHSNVVDNTYLKYYLLSPKFQNILNAKSSGGTVKGVKGSILHQQEIKYPKYEEQVKIGQHLNNLDNLITLHQRKLEHLQKLKKGLLQQMFI